MARFMTSQRVKMKGVFMSEEKMEQNAERLDVFLRHTLGYTREEAIKVTKLFLRSVKANL